VLPRLILTADLGERPARWPVVARIAFGEAEQDLGLVTDRSRTPIPYMPPSFAIAADGTFLVVDEVKQRVARFDPGGRYLGATGGLAFDRLDPHPRDIAMVGAEPYLLEIYANAGLAAGIAAVPSAPRWSLVPLFDGDRHVIGVSLCQAQAQALAQARPVVHVAGYANTRTGLPEAGIEGWVEVDPSGQVHPIPGIPVEPQRWMQLLVADDAGSLEQPLMAEYLTPATETDQPILIRLIVHDGVRTHAIPALAGFTSIAVMPHGIAAYVRISPSRTADQERYGGGRWLLVLPDDGTALTWERMPDPGVSDEQEVRRVAAGPDGDLYLMLPERRYEAFLRMP
jgi:hypothetical protein